MLASTVVDYYRRCPSQALQYHEELQRLQSPACADEYLAVYPYPFCDKYLRDYTAVEVRRDEAGLPWVNHRGRRLFFPARWSDHLTRYKYRYLCMEQDPGSPHCYLTPELKETRFDTLVDGGCAEGMLALEMIDRVERVVLVECDPCWLPALEATFAPWRDKVAILPKKLGGEDCGDSVTLAALARELRLRDALVKLDIEGFEGQALAAAGNLAGYAKAMLCCAYHRERDADELYLALERHGYRVEYSKGYMLFLTPPGWLPEIGPPYFRRGLVRAIR